MQKILACELHDYLEVACLFHYQVTLSLKDGSKVTGTAVTTRTSPQKVEHLVLTTSDGQDEIEIETLQLSKMDVLTKDARFTQVLFDS